MKKIIPLLCMLLIAFSACMPESSIEHQSGFTAHYYNFSPKTSSVSVSYFNSEDGKQCIKTVNCILDGIGGVVSKVLEVISEETGIAVECDNAYISNRIAFVSLGFEFNQLKGGCKAIIAASLACTLSSTAAADYLVLSSGGTAVRYSDTPELFFEPIPVNGNITPSVLLSDAKEAAQLLKGEDDFVFPVLLWKWNASGAAVPVVKSIPMGKTYIQSVFNAVCNENRALLYDEKPTLRLYYGEPELIEKENMAVLRVFDKVRTDITDIFLLTMRMYIPDFSVKIEYYRYTADAHLIVSKTELCTEFSDEIRGFDLACYYPSQYGLDIEKTAIRENGNQYFAAAAYCAKKALKASGIEPADTLLIYNAWNNGEEICISVTEDLITYVRTMSERAEQMFIFSLVNTMCINFSVPYIRFLCDGLTAAYIGKSVSTLKPLHYTELRFEK